MTDDDEFLAEIHPRLVAELRALHNGDPQPRLAMWSTKDRDTLFGAGMSGSGWEQVSGIFRLIASRWSDCTRPARRDPRRRGQRLPGEASTASA
jgi:hypothetical protein